MLEQPKESAYAFKGACQQMEMSFNENRLNKLIQAS